ncbi:MAG: TIGR01777 family oxidoreductase [Actinomycetota bacterium]|nr:TIGR01777 family oxidoreductase [Acidimicrobiales bacterium]MEC8815439.1 TIGR01777 family oxidoreductase [Actinomycetota bacterium]
MRTVAVTGASGLIGTALTAALEKRGDRVVPIGRRPTDGGVVWDPGARQIDETTLDDIDAVVHLAGERIDGRWTATKKRRILDSRVEGTEVLAGALANLDHPPAVVVSASAIGFYGDRGDEELTEDSQPGTGFLAEVCERWEAAAAPIASPDTRLVLARTGIVCTPDGGALGRMLALTRLGLGGRLGNGRQWWPWITLEDEVRALLHLLDTPIVGPVNLVAPGICRNAEFVRSLARALRRPAVLPAPALALRAALGEMANGLLLASARVRPARLEDSGFKFKSPDLASAMTELLSPGRPRF